MDQSVTQAAGTQVYFGLRCRRCGQQRIRVIYTRPATTAS
jgi:hypothetical protein